MPDNFVDVTGYLVIEPTHLRGDQVIKAKVSRATQRLPQLSNGEVAVRVTVRLPSAVFSPVADVFVEVPADMVAKAVVRVDKP